MAGDAIVMSMNFRPIAKKEARLLSKLSIHCEALTCYCNSLNPLMLTWALTMQLFY